MNTYLNVLENEALLKHSFKLVKEFIKLLNVIANGCFCFSVFDFNSLHF